ncbi:MAG: pilus assembly protein PilE [bacterium]|nr:pilus assembly protein PilE [bacterium]
MIVVVIISVLAAIALPSYRDKVLRSHRADGKAALTQCAVNQEREFTRRNQYASANVCAGTSPEGYYTISVAVGDMENDGSCDETGPSVLDCFVVTVTPTTKSGQDEDTTCATMTLDNMGLKDAEDDSGTSTADKCWSR